jgi:hypothetical protein
MRKHPESEQAGVDAFSPIDNEPPLVWQRVVHLAPPDGIGAGRRAVFFALLCWVPIVVWALARGRPVDAAAGESLLQHYGVHVRCLVVIPLLILAEASLHKAALRLIPQFLRNGLVPADAQPRYRDVLQTARRLRDSTLPWVFVAGAAIALSIIDSPAAHDDAMSWALDASGGMGFGGAWFAYVVRPIFIALLLGWLWRIALLTVLLFRVSRIGLDIVPSHPDHAGGLGFLEKLPGAFSLVTLAVSAMLASRWAHEILHHGQTLDALKMHAAAFVVAWTVLLLLPLLGLAPFLVAAKKKALPAYSALVAEQGRLVRRRWIDGTTQDDSPHLEPAGVGPIADAAAVYDAVKAMKSAPIGKSSLASIIVPIAVPMVVIATLQVPLKDIVVKLFKALV